MQFNLSGNLNWEGVSHLQIGKCQSGQIESISTWCYSSPGRQSAAGSTAGNLFTGLKTFLVSPPPFLQTVFYNVVWSLVPRRSYIKRPRLLAICDTASTQTSQQELGGCALYEAHLGWQALFPSDRDVYHLTVSRRFESSSQSPGLHL